MAAPVEPYEEVDHPKHYGGAEDPFEPIKVIEAWGLNFSLGSVLKYVSRAGTKPGADVATDLRKAAWYCEREAARMETEVAHHFRNFDPSDPLCQREIAQLEGTPDHALEAANAAGEIRKRAVSECEGKAY